MTIYPEVFRDCPKLTTIKYYATTPPTCLTTTLTCPTSCQFCYESCDDLPVKVKVPVGYSSTTFCNLLVEEDESIQPL